MDTVAAAVASGLISWRVPADRRRPYVPVRGPALAVALGVEEEDEDGDALAAGERDAFGDPPPHESTRTAAERRMAPRRIRPNCRV
jgi:hypothetical protein